MATIFAVPCMFTVKSINHDQATILANAHDYSDNSRWASVSHSLACTFFWLLYYLDSRARETLLSALDLTYMANMVVNTSRLPPSFSLLALYSPIHNPTGHLPSPESVHINNKHFNCSTIEWSPPYSSMNNRSDTIHVDPHITQYTVYITDNYTGDVVKVIM